MYTYRYRYLQESATFLDFHNYKSLLSAYHMVIKQSVGGVQVASLPAAVTLIYNLMPTKTNRQRRKKKLPRVTTRSKGFS